MWFSLKDISGVRFGAVYVAPRDSLYYWEYSFASILDQCISTDESVVILGDINACVPQLEVFVDQNLSMHYTQNPEKHQNANGKEMVAVCSECNLVPVNHLIYNNVHCDGSFTYNQGNRWTSQLDWVLCSKKALLT